MRKLLLSIAMAIAFVIPLSAQTEELIWTIGDENSTVKEKYPVYTYFENSYSQVLYPATDMPAGEITSISYQYGGADFTDNATIYLAEVSVTSFADSYSWLGAEGFQEVFQGQVSYTAGWVTITFTTPFVYSGTSTLAVTYISDRDSFMSQNDKFFSTPTADKKSIIANSDQTEYTLGFTSGYGTTYNGRPNTRFGMTVEEGSICYAPTNVVFSNVTPNGATLDWSCDDESTLFNIDYKALTDEDWTPFASGVALGTQTLSGLTPFTAYQVRIASDCSVEGNREVITQFMTSPDDNAFVTLPYEQNFDDVENISQWVIENKGYNGWYVGTAVNNAYDEEGTLLEGGALYVSNDGGVGNSYSIDSASVAYAYIPVRLEEGNSYRLSFDWKGGGESSIDYLRIFLVPVTEELTSTLPQTGYISNRLNMSQTWRRETVVIPDSLVGNDYKLVFVWRDDSSVGTQPGIAVDNINIDASACHRVDSIEVSSLLAGESVTSEITVYDANEGAEYLVEYRLLGTNTWETIESSSPVSLSDLQHSSIYEVRLTANCGGEDAFVSEIFTFNTVCSTISEFPWFEGFEAAWAPAGVVEGTLAAPLCWINITGKSLGSPFVWELDTYEPFEGDGAAMLYNEEDDGIWTVIGEEHRNSDWLVTPVLELTGNEILTFQAKTSEPWYVNSFNQELRIYAYSIDEYEDITSAADTVNFVLVDSLTNLSYDGYQSQEIDLTSLSGQYRLAFVRNRTLGEGATYVDNVSVRLLPSCDRVSGLTVESVSETEITLTWDETEGVSAYNIYYKVEGAADWTVESVTENTITLSELNPATLYIIDAKSVCADETETDFMREGSIEVATKCAAYPLPFLEDFVTYPASTAATSCWKEATGIYTGTTEEATAVTLNYVDNSWYGPSSHATIFGGSTAAYLNLFSTNKNEWLIMPNVDLGDGSVEYGLKFDIAMRPYNAGNISYNGERFMVLISTDDGATWNSHDELTWNSVSEDQTTNRIDLIGTTGQRPSVNLTGLGYTGVVKIAFYAEQLVSGADNYLYLDNVSINEYVNCPDLLAVSVEAASTESVALNWDSSAEEENGWTVVYAEGTTVTPDGDDVTTLSVPYETEFPYVIDGLTAGSTYTFMVQYACGGAWTPAATITLPASAIEVPYIHDFEDTDENANWVIANGTHASKFYIGAETATPEEHKLYVSSDNGATLSYNNSGTQVIYASRNLSFGEALLYKIEFDYKGGGESSYDFIKVGLLPFSEQLTPSSGYLGTDSWTYSTSSQAEFTYLEGTPKYFCKTNGVVKHAEILVDGAAVSNTIRQLVFAWRQDGSMGDGVGVQIDNISVTAINCVPPTGFEMAENGQQTTSLTFNITAQSGDSWEIQYRPYGATEWASVIATSTEDIMIDELISGTVYEFRAASICGEEVSMYSDIVLVQTTCETITVTEETPFFESFEQDTWFSDGAISSTQGAPLCWYNIDGRTPGTSYWRHSTGQSSVFSGEKALAMYSSSSATESNLSDWFITPVFDLAGTETFSFYVKTGTAAETLKVMYYSVDENGDITSKADTSDFELLQTLDLAANADWTSVDIPLSDLSGAYRLAFYASVPGNYIRIDDVYLSIQNCPRPNSLGITTGEIGATTATIDIADEQNTAWTVYYKSATETEYSSLQTTTSSVVLTGLTPATTYVYYVVANCGESESAPTVEQTFATACYDGIISEFPWTEGFDSGVFCWSQENVSGSVSWTATDEVNNDEEDEAPIGVQSAKLYYASSSLNYVTRLVSPLLDLSALDSPTLTFQHMQPAWGNDQDELRVYYRTSEDSEPVLLATYTNDIQNWQTETFALTDVSSTFQIIFEGTTSYGYGVYVDDVTITGEGGTTPDPEPCDAPTNLTVSNITTTEATVTWVGTASAYEIKLNGGAAETVQTTTKTFANLTASTNYTVEVRAVCEGANSEWATTTFSTLAEQGGEVITPTVATLAATDVTFETAVLNGTVAAGSETITAQGFKYQAQGAAEWTEVAASGATMTATLTGLTAETVYSFKAFATTASGTTDGEIMTFTTTAAPVVVTPPTVATLAASEITTNSATLNGTITAGNEEITSQGFMYRQAGAAEWTTVEAAGETIAATLTGLAAATTYNYKAFAITASGITEGAEMSFTTLAGLADVANGAINAMIYPNPASDKATLSVEGLNAEAQIVVSDAQGRILMTDTMNAGENTYELNTANYAAGVYYVRIISGNTISTQKLIVK